MHNRSAFKQRPWFRVVLIAAYIATVELWGKVVSLAPAGLPADRSRRNDTSLIAVTWQLIPSPTAFKRPDTQINSSR